MSPAPTPLDYSNTPSRPPLRWLAVTVAVLVVVQLPWFCAWAIETQGWLPDGSPKEPLYDFGVEVGVTIPTIGILAACLLHLGQRRRRGARLQDDVPALVTVALSLLVIGIAVAGWVWDDLIHHAIPHGV